MDVSTKTISFKPSADLTDISRVGTMVTCSPETYTAEVLAIDAGANEVDTEVKPLAGADVGTCVISAGLILPCSVVLN